MSTKEDDIEVAYYNLSTGEVYHENDAMSKDKVKNMQVYLNSVNLS